MNSNKISKFNKDRYLKSCVTYETPYGKVFINYEAENIAVRVSGGFDSAVMLYLIAKTLNDKNKNSVIHPVTIIKGNPTDIKQYNGFDTFKYADSIIEWVKHCFPNVKFNDSIKDVANYWWITREEQGKPIGSYTYVQNLISDYMVWRYVLSNTIKNKDNIVYAEYVGTTKNPSDKDFPKSLEKHRDTNSPNTVKKNSVTVANFEESHVYVEPFRNADKRLTFWLADSFGILDTLLSITRSCEGNSNNTDNFTKECKSCWWCAEREWGKINFNKYIYHDR